MSQSPATASEQHLDLPGDRVREHTSPDVLRRIDAATQASIDACIQQGPTAVTRRLAELDREWDIDRTLMVAFSAVGGTVLANGLRRYADAPPFGERPKGLLYLFGAQLGFLALHGIVGWCPPAALFRRLGYRTAREIESERRALEQYRDERKVKTKLAAAQEDGEEAQDPPAAKAKPRKRARTNAAVKA